MMIWKILEPAAVYSVLLLLAGVLSQQLRLGLDSAGLALAAALLSLPLIRWMCRETPLRISDEEQQAEKNAWTLAFLKGACLVCCLLLGAFLSWGSARLFDFLGVSKVAAGSSQEGLYASSIWTLLAGPGLLVPVAEELIYRGLVLTRMRQTIALVNQSPVTAEWFPRIRDLDKGTRPSARGADAAGTVLAVLTSAGLFAAGHGDLSQMLYAFPMGLVLAGAQLAAERSGWYRWPLLVPIALHIGANGISILCTCVL